MNWASFGYGFSAAAVTFCATSAGVSYYFLKHPQLIFRRMMRQSVKQRKAA